MQKWMVLILVVLCLVSPLKAYAAPFKLTLTEGVIQPIPYAAPVFVAENRAAEDWSKKITALVVQDLTSPLSSRSWAKVWCLNRSMTPL